MILSGSLDVFDKTVFNLYDCCCFFLLDAKPSTTNGVTNLTMDAVLKHDARQSFVGDNKTVKSVASTKSEPTVHDIAMSLHSFSMSDGDDDQSYARTFQTFGSRYSSCTNMTFNKYETSTFYGKLRFCINSDFFPLDS